MHVLRILFKTIPSLARVFDGGSVVVQLVLLFQFWYFAITRKTVFRGREMKFALHYLQNSFDLYIESIVDLAVLDEVFLQEEYRWELPNSPKVILDLGAHFGDTSLYYHFKYPEATILALEPAPATFKRLCKNVKLFSNIIPMQAGVADSDGFADLHVSQSSIGSSFSSRSGTTEIVVVPILTLQTIFEKHGIERAGLIKFDIEGAEEMLFKEGSAKRYSDAYIGEVHGDLMSISKESFIARFAEFTVNTMPMRNTKRVIITCVKK